jgi:hypothetical protein
MANMRQAGFETVTAWRPVRSGLWGRLAIVLLLVAALSVLLSPGALAARAWCKTDPLIMVDGDLANIFVMSSLTAPLKVTGPTEIVVAVPEGVSARLIFADLGFGRGQVVRFVTDPQLQVTDVGRELRIAVRVPARDAALPVRVEFAPHILGILAPASAEGLANEWVTLSVVF